MRKSTVEQIRERFDNAVLHHLRGEAEWELVYAKLYQARKSGGSLWISHVGCPA